MFITSGQALADGIVGEAPDAGLRNLLVSQAPRGTVEEPPAPKSAHDKSIVAGQEDQPVRAGESAETTDGGTHHPLLPVPELERAVRGQRDEERLRGMKRQGFNRGAFPTELAPSLKGRPSQSWMTGESLRAVARVWPSGLKARATTRLGVCRWLRRVLAGRSKVLMPSQGEWSKRSVSATASSFPSGLSASPQAPCFNSLG